mgnify:CR=1 FL=1
MLPAYVKLQAFVVGAEMPVMERLGETTTFDCAALKDLPPPLIAISTTNGVPTVTELVAGEV